MDGKKQVQKKKWNFFYQDRIEDVKKNIRPALKDKKVIIMDRYYFSNIAYQSARGLNPDVIEKRNERIAPKPNLLIILDITPQVALKRIKEKRNGRPNHFERIKHLGKVREIFLKRFKTREYTAIIDGDDAHSESTISEEIWNIVKPIVKEAKEVQCE